MLVVLQLLKTYLLNVQTLVLLISNLLELLIRVKLMLRNYLEHSIWTKISQIHRELVQTNKILQEHMLTLQLIGLPGTQTQLL